MLADVPCDAVVLGGDTGQARSVVGYLDTVATAGRPTYFVLGNHDFYGGSISGVRRIQALCRDRRDLSWLPDAGVVALTDQTCLVGHDGWGDGRLGDYWALRVQLNDFLLIEELAGLSDRDRLARLNALGDEAAAHLRAVLPEALDRFGHVLVAIHVPPFRDACWHEGRISDDDWLPHFTCAAAGEVLRAEAARQPDRAISVLCGHTHGAGEVLIAPNLRVITGGAAYGRPAIQAVLEVR